MAFALVFPGQGSQSVGMMAAYGESAVIRDTFAEASEALGEDLWAMVCDGPAERLALTVNTQPLMLTAGVAAWRAWLAAGGTKPALVAGHSLGEYSALVAAGALDFTDALQLVRYRAEQMQAAVPVGEGTMAAILGLSDDQVKTVCLECATNGVVEAVNFNTPGQVVIAGTVAAVQEAMEKSLAAGAKRAIKLNVSGPFHSSLMKPAALAMEEKLKTVDLQKPFLPVLHNVDVQIHEEPDAIRDVLAAQVASPVLWADTVRKMEEAGVMEIYEVGPGAALSGMVKRITKGITAKASNSRAALEEAAAANQEK